MTCLKRQTVRKKPHTVPSLRIGRELGHHASHTTTILAVAFPPSTNRHQTTRGRREASHTAWYTCIHQHHTVQVTTRRASSYPFMHISKCASCLHERDQRTLQVMTSEGASGVIALVGATAIMAVVCDAGVPHKRKLIWHFSVPPASSLPAVNDGTVCGLFLTVCRSRQVIHAM